MWSVYVNKGSILDYKGLLNAEEGEAFGKTETALLDYQAQTLPNVIKGKTTWEAYVDGLEAIQPESVVEYLQNHIME